MNTDAGRVVRPGWLVWTTRLLDALIAAYALSLCVIAAGGLTLPGIKVANAAKPIVVLIVAIPVRLALGGGVPVFPRAVASVRARFGTLLAATPASLFDVGAALLITRPPALAAAFIANILFPAHGYRAFAMPFEHARWFEIFAAWDSGWYFTIAKNGYYYTPNAQSPVAFFPLYPMAMRAVAFPFGGSDPALWLAGMAISWLAFAAALIVLHRFTVRLFGDREVARRTVWYVAIFPFSFFFTRVYTESLFLLVSLAAIVAAYDKRWWLAGAFGALTALTRPNGVLVCVPLFFLMWRGAPPWRELARRAAALSLAPLGLVGYCVFIYTLTGSPLAWLDAQRQWSYSVGNAPWAQLLKLVHGLIKYGPYGYLFTSTLAPYELFHGVTALLFLALTPAVFRYAGFPLGMYVLVSLLVPLSGSDLQGLGRYASVLFPVFMIAGLRSGRLHEAVLITGVCFYTLFVSLFVMLHPIF